MEPSFEPVGDDGLAVVDSIDRHRYVLTTPAAVTPTPADTAAFRFPVDAAVSVRTDAISLPSVVSVHIRDGDGTTVCTAEHFADVDLPSGEYTIELSAPLKLYLQIESSLTVTADAERMSIAFGDSTEVVIGARSHHSHPAATVTTPADPESMMRAVSTFGSALKTTSPERSYPTLRGHPPELELGDELDLAGLSPPDTGVTIEVPPTYRAVFVVAPLAYYLGARVVPGDSPTLRTDRGFEYELDGPLGFERTVERVLKQVFFLDCLTRTEGLYPVDLHERRAVEAGLGLDFAALYECSLAEQLETYLDVEFEALEAHIPEWKLTAHVEPTPHSVEMLPFLVDDLAVVRCGGMKKVTNPAGTMISNGMTRATAAAAGIAGGDFTRSMSRGAPVETVSTYLKPEPSDSLEQAWVGEGTPLGASKATIEAYRNRLDRTPADGDITVTVVCNDPDMDEERDIVDEIYGDRDLPFDVTVERDLTAAELRDVLSTHTDFLHYVGHVDTGGFDCVDGTLDAETLDSVGVDAFLLNACQSYNQGMSLLKKGSIGGIVTLSEVLNSEAVTMGHTLARLLNAGFPLRAALNIAKDESIMGDEYLVVGDGGFAIAQSTGGVPNLCEIERVGESFEMEFKTYATTEMGIGTLIVPYVNKDSQYYLASGTAQTYKLSKEELNGFFELENVPVRVNNKLRWSGDLDLDNV